MKVKVRLIFSQVTFQVTFWPSKGYRGPPQHKLNKKLENSYIEMQMSFQKTKIKKLKIFYILSFLIEFLKNSEDFQQYSA